MHNRLKKVHFIQVAGDVFDMPNMHRGGRHKLDVNLNKEVGAVHKGWLITLHISLA